MLMNDLKLLDDNVYLNVVVVLIVDGTKQLNDGATKLSDGIVKFDNEGIRKISNLVNGDLQNLVTRGKKIEQLANEYDKFNSDEKREDISFISIVDSIKQEEKNEDEKSN